MAVRIRLASIGPARVSEIPTVAIAGIETAVLMAHHGVVGEVGRRSRATVRETFAALAIGGREHATARGAAMWTRCLTTASVALGSRLEESSELLESSSL